MRQTISFHHGPTIPHLEGVGLRNRPSPAQCAGRDSRFRLYFSRYIPVLDVVIALTLLVAVLTASNLHRIPSISAFLALRVTVKNVALLAVFTLFWVQIAYAVHLFSRSGRGCWAELKRVLILSCVGSAPVLLFPLTTVSGAFGWPQFFLYWGASLVSLLASRAVLRMAGTLIGPRLTRECLCLIVGSGARARLLAESLRSDIGRRYEILGFIDASGGHVDPAIAADGLVGGVPDLPAILKDTVVDEVLIALPVKSCYAEIQSVITVCEQVGVQCTIPSDIFNYSIAKPRPTRDPVFRVAIHVVHAGRAIYIKRLIDIIGAIVGLGLLAPLMVAIAFAVRVSSPGPVLFRQIRYGLNKRVFTMIKFRTMYADAERRQSELEELNEMAGPVFKIKDDPRITPVGRLLRHSSLDELPQLWNVLTGAMSLVGPRPLPTRDVSRFSEAWLMRRFSVKPGITGLWQVSGRNDVGFDQWIRLDLEYIDNWSLALDLRILLRTVVVVLKGLGAQ